MRIFFTSDHHFGHGNIIKYTGRPFSNAREMDEIMIERWNEVVSKWDLVYCLGDLTLRNDGTKYLAKLNGRIFVLCYPWHHDKRWIPLHKLIYSTTSFSASFAPNIHSQTFYPITVLPPMVVLEKGLYYPAPITLCHYPVAEWDRKHYGAWHLHGHSHGKHNGEGKIMDVGVDCNNFYPVSLEQVAEYMETR